MNRFVLFFFGVWVLVFVLAPAGAEDAAAPADTAAAAGEARVPIPLELPPPVYGGTPLAYWSDRLEVRLEPRKPFEAPLGTVNQAKGKDVTSSAKPKVGSLALVTDGVKKAAEDTFVELPAGPQYVQIDLGAVYRLYAVVVWHFHAEERVYFDTVCRASQSEDFPEGAPMLYNNDHDGSSGLGKGEDPEYIESNEGLLIDAKGAEARYVRLYSNGNTTNDFNHYTEVEVYAKPRE